MVLSGQSLSVSAGHRTYDQAPETLEARVSGEVIYALIRELFPICRSITGDGIRRSLARIGELLPPLTLHEVASGTPVFDWEVPREWNIRDAYIKGPSGEKIVDFKASNLHVLNYSAPVHRTMTLEELRPHLHSLLEHPDWIPYLTSYYNETWGFCLTHRQLLALEPGEYEVCIDATLAPGRLTYGELFLPGQSDEEILFSTYLCHPSLCNDNLSGPAVQTFLARYLMALPQRKYSYRFLFIPETIGSIVWLARNQESLSRVRGGYIVTCTGDPGMSTYKKTRQGDAWPDRVMEKVLRDSGEPYRMEDFYPWGSDERQFSSPGINLPMGLLMRTPYAQYPEYHTSADNLSFIQPDCLQNTFEKYLNALYILEHDRTVLGTNPHCEPQLGRRGLYQLIGGQKEIASKTAMLWVLNLADGRHSLLDMAYRSGLRFDEIKSAADLLSRADLLQPVANAP